MVTPHLEQREAFEAALEDYHIDPEVYASIEHASLALLTAPTAVGRNTIINELVKTGKYQFIVTDTTRPPRVNNGVLERDGIEYFFRHEADMLDDIEHGRFLEAAIIHNQQVSGVSAREVAKADRQGKISITDIEVNGTDNIMRQMPDATAIFVLPPSFDEWLNRLKRRNPTMTHEELVRRLRSAVKEFIIGLNRQYYRFVINDSLAEATKAIDAIIRLHQVDEPTQIKARELIKMLLTQTEAFLNRETGSTT